MSEFSERLQKLRKINRWTQSELSKRASISPSTIGMYEQGLRTPSLENLETLCDIFNVDMDYMMGRSDVTTRLLNEKEIINQVNSGVLIDGYWNFEDKETINDIIYNENSHFQILISLNMANTGEYFGLAGVTNDYPGIIEHPDTIIVRKIYNLPKGGNVKNGDYVLFINNEQQLSIGFVTLKNTWDPTIVYFKKGIASVEIIESDNVKSKILGTIIESRVRFTGDIPMY